MIAIDASLGTKSHVGFLTVSKGALEPGLGVHKSLPPVGDISITGIVNIAGAFDHFLLQSTRLATVVQMADSIVSGILLAHRQYFGPRLFPAGPFSSCLPNALEALQNSHRCLLLPLLPYQKAEHSPHIHSPDQILFHNPLN